MTAQVFTKRPPDFGDVVEVVACFCEWDDKILLLKRHPDDTHGDTWNAPGGGIEPAEELLVATARELMEETGIVIEVGKLEFLTTLFIQIPDQRYVFHMFRARFTEQPEVALSLDENVEAKWVTIPEAQQLPFLPGGKEALDYYLKHRA